MSDTAQLRYNKLQELHTFYQTHQTITQSLGYISIGSLIIAWILSFFIGFTLPFFFLHSIGTSLWLYQYLFTNNKLKQKWDIIKDPLFWFLSITTLITLIYILITSSRCSLK